MSSMRNAVQRRSHRERAQPLERRRLGLLEKHKDYSLRAQDYNKKKAQLRSLRDKAANRNEDEFYFSMLSRAGPSGFVSKGKRWTGTVDGDRGNRALDVDTVRLLKTQDAGYLRTMRNVVAKEVKALEERVILAGGADLGDDENDDDDDQNTQPKKIVFVDDAEERERVVGSGSREEDDEEEEEEEEDDDDDRKKARNLEKLQRRLQTERRRLQALTDAETELDAQRAKMAKTPSYTGITNKGKKVKARERKR